jgi:hypothetical protein
MRVRVNARRGSADPLHEIPITLSAGNPHVSFGVTSFCRSVFACSGSSSTDRAPRTCPSRPAAARHRSRVRRSPSTSFRARAAPAPRDHGHPPLTAAFTIEAMPGLLTPFRALYDRSLAAAQRTSNPRVAAAVVSSKYRTPRPAALVQTPLASLRGRDTDGGWRCDWFSGDRKHHRESTASEANGRIPLVRCRSGTVPGRHATMRPLPYIKSADGPALRLSVDPAWRRRGRRTRRSCAGAATD